MSGPRGHRLGSRRPANADQQRLDLLLVERGLAPSRSKARAMIMAGEILVEGQRIDKPAASVHRSATIAARAAARFVSRGGDKLDHGLRRFAPHGLVVEGRICLDIGASTGGFTDCLLQHGATKVYAVDVGYGQLHHRLRSDPRVAVRERFNARYLRAEELADPIELCVVDASFIGIGKLLPAVAATLVPKGELVALLKPQFEVGRREAARAQGVIRDEQVRREAIERAAARVVAAGFEIVAQCDSPLRGPKGNLERLIYARRRAAGEHHPGCDG